MFGFSKKLDPTELVNGEFGKTAAGTIQDLVQHFSSLPGWEAVEYDIHELVWMVGFLSHAALERNKDKVKIEPKNMNAVGTGVAVKVCQGIAEGGFDNDMLQWCLKSYAKRASDYSYALNKIEFAKDPKKLAKMFFENAQSNEIKNFSGLDVHYANFERAIERMISKLTAAL
jgi:hypothetical protein